MEEEPMYDLLKSKRNLLKEKIKKLEWESFIKPPGMKDPDRFPRTPNTLDAIPLVAGDYVPIKIMM